MFGKFVINRKATSLAIYANKQTAMSHCRKSFLNDLKEMLYKNIFKVKWPLELPFVRLPIWKRNIPFTFG